MNEELQNALATLLAKTTNAAEAGANFLQAELPEVIRQLLMWHAVKSAILFVIAVCVTGAAAWMARRVWQWARSEDNCMEPFAAIPVIVSLTAMLVAIESLDWLQIWIAPKVYLIEYAASLAK